MSKVQSSSSSRPSPFISIKRRFTFQFFPGAYLRLVWLDLSCILLVALLTLLVYFIPTYHFSHRKILYLQSGSGTPRPAQLELLYPEDTSPLSSWACGVIVVAIPLITITGFQLKVKSFWDFHAGIFGTLKSLIATTFICTMLKQFVGGFRPFFIEVCKPDLGRLVPAAENSILFLSVSDCMGDPAQIKKALQTFPSGHTSSAFATATFLALYVNGKLKPIVGNASHFGTFMVALTPLIAATLMGGSMYVSNQHHASDCIWGMLLGSVLGIIAYRSSYASVFDSHCNHIPLPPRSANIQFSISIDDLLRSPPSLTAMKLDEVDKLVTQSRARYPESRDLDKVREVLWLHGERKFELQERIRSLSTERPSVLLKSHIMRSELPNNSAQYKMRRENTRAASDPNHWRRIYCNRSTHIRTE